MNKDESPIPKSFTLDQDVVNALTETSEALRRSASSLVNEILAEKFGLQKQPSWMKKK